MPLFRIDPAGSLTAQQVLEAWPEIGPAPLVHDLACSWRLEHEGAACAQQLGEGPGAA